MESPARGQQLPVFRAVPGPKPQRGGDRRIHRAHPHPEPLPFVRRWSDDRHRRSDADDGKRAAIPFGGRRAAPAFAGRSTVDHPGAGPNRGVAGQAAPRGRNVRAAGIGPVVPLDRRRPRLLVRRRSSTATGPGRSGPSDCTARALDVPAVLPLRPIAERRCAVVIAMGEATVDAAAIETVVRGQSRHGWEVHLVILGGARVVWDPLPGLAALPTLLFPMLLRGAEGPPCGPPHTSDRSFDARPPMGKPPRVQLHARRSDGVRPRRAGGVRVAVHRRLAGPNRRGDPDARRRGTLDAIDTATASYGGLTSLLGALAFEHALTGIIPGREDIASLLKGLGVPDNKIWREGTAE